jgi:multidrug efflux system membrane fusion protein
MKKQIFTRKAIAIAVALLVVGGVGTLSVTSRASKAPVAQSAPAAVSVAAVIEKSVIEWDDFSGRVEAIERVEIRPRVAGTIDAVHFKEGQLVKKGDALFTIDPRPYQAEVARAEAAQAGAQARLVLTKTELDRTRKLVETHAVAQRELDQRDAPESAVHGDHRACRRACIARRAYGRQSRRGRRRSPGLDDARFSVAGLCQLRSR